jgi:hypothetical protein
MSGNFDVMKSLAEIDGEHVMKVCGNVTRTEHLIAWMNELIEENNALLAAIAESDCDRSKRDVQIEHLASQISVYRRIRSAASSALESAGDKPSTGKVPEPAGGLPL